MRYNLKDFLGIIETRTHRLSMIIYQLRRSSYLTFSQAWTVLNKTASPLAGHLLTVEDMLYYSKVTEHPQPWG